MSDIRLDPIPDDPSRFVGGAGPEEKGKRKRRTAERPPEEPEGEPEDHYEPAPPEGDDIP